MKNNNEGPIAIRVLLLAITILLLCMAFYCFDVANAADSPPLQDFCVATDDPSSSVYVNGKMCKNPRDVKIDDFLYKGFNKRGNITHLNKHNAKATLVDVNSFPGLNSLGVAVARVDFGPGGINAPHWHQRGSEVFIVMEGSLDAGFVTEDKRLFMTQLDKGDMIVFPQALVHFQMNRNNKKRAYAIAAFGAQNPGRIDVADTVFGTHPIIRGDILSKTFQVNENVIHKLRLQFADDE